MNEQPKQPAQAPTRGEIARCASLAALAIAAFGLSYGSEELARRTAALRHENALAVQEAVMIAATRERRETASPTRSGWRNSTLLDAHMRRGKGTGGRKLSGLSLRRGWPSGPS